MVHHADLTSLGIIVDRCETPDHIRRMFVAISKIGAVALSAHHNSNDSLRFTHVENKRNVLLRS